MSVTVTVPLVQSASMFPNPANINTAVSLVVQVIEQSIVLNEIYPYSGQPNIFSGEVMYLGNNNG